MVERYRPLVYSIPARYGLGPEESDDIAQKVWISIRRRLPQLRDHSLFSAWLIAITYHEMYRVVRQKRGVQAAAHLQQTCDYNGFEQPKFERAEWNISLSDALRILTPSEYRLIRAIFSEEPPTQAVLSTRLRIPRGSIHMFLTRALSKLRAELLPIPSRSSAPKSQ